MLFWLLCSMLWTAGTTLAPLPAVLLLMHSWNHSSPDKCTTVPSLFSFCILAPPPPPCWYQRRLQGVPGHLRRPEQRCGWRWKSRVNCMVHGACSLPSCASAAACTLACARTVELLSLRVLLSAAATAKDHSCLLPPVAFAGSYPNAAHKQLGSTICKKEGLCQVTQGRKKLVVSLLGTLFVPVYNSN